MRSYRLAVVALTLLGSAACASSRPATTHSSAESEGVAPATRPRFIQIRNQNPLDVAVYLLRAGTRFRIGTVTALSNDRIRLPMSIEGDGSVRLLIDPIGGGDVYVTDGLIIGSDQHVEITVSRMIRMSSMSVWTQR